MVRTQIQLTEEQFKFLKHLSSMRQESLSNLIRRGVDMLIQSIPETDIKEKKQRAINAAGSLSIDIPDLSINHDKYLFD
jgi:hypothetical protein